MVLRAEPSGVTDFSFSQPLQILPLLRRVLLWLRLWLRLWLILREALWCALLLLLLLTLQFLQ